MKAKERIGSTINGFQILDCKRDKGSTYYYVQCPFCPTKKWMHSSSITNGNSVSCGCRNKIKKISPKHQVDLTDRTFYKLKVIEKVSGNGISSRWRCECECGNKEYIAEQGWLLDGRVKSCGCGNRSSASARIKSNLGLVNGTNISTIASKKIYASNTTGVRGVSLNKKLNKYFAYIQFQGKLRGLGLYSTLEEASRVRAEAEKQVYGEFMDWYKENFPDQYKKFDKPTD